MCLNLRGRIQKVRNRPAHQEGTQRNVCVLNCRLCMWAHAFVYSPIVWQFSWRPGPISRPKMPPREHLMVLFCFLLGSLVPFIRFLPDQSTLKHSVELIFWCLQTLPFTLLYYLAVLLAVISFVFTTLCIILAFQLLKSFLIANPRIIHSRRFRLTIRKVSHLCYVVLFQHR